MAPIVTAHFGGRGTRKRKSLAFRLLFSDRLCKQGGFLMVVKRLRGAVGRVINPERVYLWRCYSIFLREGQGRKMLKAMENAGWAESQCHSVSSAQIGLFSRPVLLFLFKIRYVYPSCKK